MYDFSLDFIDSATADEKYKYQQKTIAATRQSIEC